MSTLISLYELFSLSPTAQKPKGTRSDHGGYIPFFGIGRPYVPDRTKKGAVPKPLQEKPKDKGEINGFPESNGGTFSWSKRFRLLRHKVSLSKINVLEKWENERQLWTFLRVLGWNKSFFLCCSRQTLVSFFEVQASHVFLSSEFCFYFEFRLHQVKI